MSAPSQPFHVALAVPYVVRPRLASDTPLDPVTGMAITVSKAEPRIELGIVTPHGSSPHSGWPSEDLYIDFGTEAEQLNILAWDVFEVLRGVDLVHVFQPFTVFGELVVVVAKALGRRICISDARARTSNAGLSLDLHHLADALISGSDFETMSPSHAIPTHIIRGGVDTAFFSPSPEGRRRSTLVYLAGSLAAEDVERIMPNDSVRVPLVLCTTRPDPDELVERLGQGGWDASVYSEQDLRAKVFRNHCRQARAVIFTSPNPVRSIAGQDLFGPQMALEAMACSAPIVAVRNSPAAEVVLDGITGLLVDGIEEIPQAVRRLIRSRRLADSLGIAARETVVRDFSASRVGEHLAHIYGAFALSNGLANR